jgi:alpha-galactosidase
MLDAWGSGDRPVEPLLAETSQEAKVGHSAAEIMGDIVAGRTRRRPSFIVPNDGYIDNLPADSAVEVPGIVEGGQALGVPVGVMPEPVATLLRHELAIEDAAVEAALEGSRDLAMRALLLDPVVTSVAAAERFLDDALRIHREWLPRFWS